MRPVLLFMIFVACGDPVDPWSRDCSVSFHGPHGGATWLGGFLLVGDTAEIFVAGLPDRLDVSVARLQIEGPIDRIPDGRWAARAPGQAVATALGCMGPPTVVITIQARPARLGFAFGTARQVVGSSLEVDLALHDVNGTLLPHIPNLDTLLRVVSTDRSGVQVIEVREGKAVVTPRDTGTIVLRAELRIASPPVSDSAVLHGYVPHLIGFAGPCGVAADRAVYCIENGGLTLRGGEPSSHPFSEVAEVLPGNAACILDPEGRLYCAGVFIAGVFYDAVQPAYRFSQFSPILFGPTWCGLTGDSVVCWGDARNGGLGAPGNETCESPGGPAFTYPCARTPVRVQVTEPVSRLRAPCVVTVSGILYCWGPGYGQTPVRQHPGWVWRDVVPGWERTGCGLAADSTAWCWGTHIYGLGDGTTTTSAVPVRVGTGRYVAITGAYAKCGLTDAGGVECWGGSAAPFNHTVPTPLNTALRFVSISVDFGRGCGVSLEGAPYCWGTGDLGFSGDTASAVPVPVLGRWETRLPTP